MNFDDPIAKALRYVGSYGCHEEAGRFQFDLLIRHGLHTGSRVLEIGCGCLVIGHKIIDFLDEGNYVSIEPNTWLVEAGQEFFRIGKQFKHLTVTDFQADSHFDFIYSHSILSHASKHQLPEYFNAVKKQLKPNGIALASIRFNVSPDGRLYYPSDSNNETWEYPAISWFTRETVQRVAFDCGVIATERKDIQIAFSAATNGNHHHDWIEITHT